MSMAQLVAQMRAARAAAVDATDAIGELSDAAGVYASKRLATILAPGGGPVLGDTSAMDLVGRYNELLELQKTEKNVFLKQNINESIQKTAAYFQKFFGGELGPLKSLAKEFRDYLAATKAMESAPSGGSTSGTLGKKPGQQCGGNQSLAILKWSGGLR